ncbi:presenilin ER Ca2+ leak channel family [Micromonas commoda]|uniref:Presenilin n=1 Tax=Micromonas commoda (strain RCC299 / NOUM17 / CCMP2709) TaxID=296587 RepID=C1DYR1_MICCC|nr:presenilin ER Ca2+ leak channel family [Micromonas commoda]ACO60988.1 presenilin ER Ca2+ leak channel family [Micromonas commoda]|eukprot:XP_002499730.1 presenilin ER Ca2+ leak channel family [Micromonas commoda]
MGPPMFAPSRRPGAPPELLDTGEEIIAIVTPVSICMLIVVFLVLMLRVDNPNTMQMQGGIAMAAYQEEESDSNSDKLAGAIENSLVFVAFITAATFLIFFLFKYNYTRCLWAYMGFSGLLIFGVLGAAIGYELIQTLMIPLDILTYSLCVYNVSIVGVLAVFFWPSPLAMRQGYLIAIAAIVAFYFTRIPEWTTWTLLIAMAVYDLYAVLTPGGPLRVIVELAEERNEEIPALVYEARPIRRPVRVNRGGAGGGGDDSESAPLVSRGYGASGDLLGSNALIDPESNAPEYVDPVLGGKLFALPDSIKLGLGDFIFYSVLVARAALYDTFVATSCFLAVLQGLVGTLFLLGVYERALPALPISIAFGVLAYFGSRYALEPVAMEFASQLVFPM